jgi:hypothetical protein
LLVSLAKWTLEKILITFFTANHLHTKLGGEEYFISKFQQNVLFHKISLSTGKKSVTRIPGRVARWFVFKPKIPIWVNFLGSCNGKSVYVTYDHLVYFTAIGIILWPLGKFCRHLVYFPRFWYFVPRKIWQTLIPGGNRNQFEFLNAGSKKVKE